MSTTGDSSPESGRRAQRPTLAEVARAAGVNKSTVSRALHGEATVGYETRERIQRLAADLHYEPDASAQRLSRASTNVLAFVSSGLTRSPGTSDPFMAELLGCIVQESAAQTYDVLLCLPTPDPDDVNTYRRIVGGRHADGLMLMDLRPKDPCLDYLQHMGFPHVLFGRPEYDMQAAEEYPYPWVEVDNRAGMRTSILHLIELGHQRIGLIGGHNEYFWEIDRRVGYQDALAEAGLAFDPSLVLPGGLTQDDGYALARHLLERGQPPTALCAMSDVLAVGAIRAAGELGLTVGRAFPIIGFDGIGLGTFVTPTLTTLRQPIAQVGRLLVQLLTEYLRHPDQPRHVLLAPELVVRASTRRT